MNENRLCIVVGACPPGLMILPQDAFIIACDGGVRYLEDWGPDLIVGDFDSFDIDRIPPDMDCPVLRLPCEKDDTDIMAALREGIRRGFRRFLLYGCMGGRPDHAYANYQVLGWLTEQGAQGWLCGEGWLVTHIEKASMTIHGAPGRIFSVFAPEGRAAGVSIENARYPLQDAELSGAFPLGVSNEFRNGPVRISVEEGRLLVMWQGDLTKQGIL